MWTARSGNKITFEDECARMRLLDTASVRIVPGPVTLGDFNRRIMEPHAKAEADKEDLRLTIAEMRDTLEMFSGQTLDEDQWKRLGKAARQLRKMGGPKTAIDGATWRKLHQGVELAPNEMTLREAGGR